MRLIRRTYFYTLRWILPVTVLGTVMCFFTIEYIAHEETDEFLTYEMQRIIDYHKENGNLSDFHNVAEILPDRYYPQPIFRDTLLLEPADNEMVPYRELRFSLKHKGRNMGIVVRHLLLGTDDIIEGTVFIVVTLMLLMAVVIFLMLNRVAGRIWKPFYSTLNRLTSYKIQEEAPEFESSDIEEFQRLNGTLSGILRQMHEDYRSKKEFTENISHELQTHLAIIRLHTEKLLNELGEEDPRLEELQTIYRASSDLIRIQKSLTQLSQISAGEFSNVKAVNLEKVVRKVLGYYEEPIQMKSIDLVEELQKCKVHVDEGLAEILVNNLVKNAVKYCSEEGTMRVHLDKKRLIVENTGVTYHGNPAEMLKRFSHGPGGNTGIGLSIVQEICNRYGFKLRYELKGKNQHRLVVTFTKN